MPPALKIRAIGRRDKLSPDPAVRREIVAAAIEIVGVAGIQGLNVAAVLERCGLGTRAFYRHFASKDELVAALFLETARAESRRLRRKMARASNVVDAIAMWIDSRLDLAFNPSLSKHSRLLSEEAQALMFTTPVIDEAFAETLTPLIEQLEKGLARGVFTDIDPVTSAQIIHGSVWACTHRQWAIGSTDRAMVRAHLLRACLKGLDVR